MQLTTGERCHGIEGKSRSVPVRKVDNIADLRSNPGDPTKDGWIYWLWQGVRLFSAYID
jgi:hypothetical protein